MTHQTPSSRVAETRDFAGPFLRFGSGTGPGEEDQWRGSALCLTRQRTSARAGAAADDPAATARHIINGNAPTATHSPEAAQSAGGGTAQNGSEPPILFLTDRHSGHDTSQGANGGEQQLTPSQLDSCLGWTFWRFDLDLRLSDAQRPVQYRIEAGGASTLTFTFWLPGIGQPMHWGYYSCAGMSEDAPPTAPERQDPTYLWRDLMQLHFTFPLHCLVGGGDQVYSDGVWKCPSLNAWGSIAGYAEKTGASWTPDMESETTQYYLENYIDAFSATDVDVALAQIPQVMMWDDHDATDGFNSWAPQMQNSAVLQGVIRIARRFYLLFQHHTTDDFNNQAKEFLVNDGSSFHYLKYLGPQVALLGIDMRTQRTHERIMPQSTYDLLKRTVAEIPDGPLHLVVMSGVPVIFPKAPGAEFVLGCVSKLTQNVPAVGGLARKAGVTDRYDKPEILDDLYDGWVADVHTDERLQFIHLLQEFSTTRNLRVSIISGDAHVGGIGRFYSRPKMKHLADDPLYICQIISSAIVNAPPPHPVVKMLMRTNFASNVDGRTREKLVRAFYPYHPRTDKLIAQRNWCDVSLVAPPFSAPTVAQDPDFGGLRFVLRVENPRNRRGFAEETYVVVVPRHPNASKEASGASKASQLMQGAPGMQGLPQTAWQQGEPRVEHPHLHRISDALHLHDHDHVHNNKHQRQQRQHDVQLPARVAAAHVGPHGETLEHAAASSKEAVMPAKQLQEDAMHGPPTPSPAMS